RNPSEDLSALTFNDGNGASIKMADTGAKVRLVNLWATWCAPCREEMPYLETLQAERGGDEFGVVAISVDGGGPEKPRNFYEEIGLTTLPFYHDPSIGVFTELKKQSLAFGLPVTLLIDQQNRVIANMNGPAQWASPDAFAMIDAAIAAAKN
ncbi:MAG: TlpA disulfide reductase family protein, partial [Pseudomonadota bacterium]